MPNRTLLCLSSLLCAAPAAAERPQPLAADPGLGVIKHFSCYGTTFEDDFSDAELDEGAYSARCYDERGKPVGKIHHGPVWDVFTRQPGEEAVTVVSFSHYNEDGKEDGYLLRTAVFSDCSTERQAPPLPSLPVGTFQGVVALETPKSQIDKATGWFAGTQQVINRTNVKVRLLEDRPGLRIYFNNFSSFSFLQQPVTIDAVNPLCPAP